MTAVHDDFEAEKKAGSSVMELKCRAIEEKITKQIDQACINLREDFAREKERRDESQKRREKKVADEILRITESLDIERKNRLAGENGIYTKMNEKLRDGENALLDERKGRIELDTVFSETLEEKALIVQLEMAQEKKQRQENAK